MANGRATYIKKPEDAYSIKEIMNLAGVSRTTVYNYFNLGNLQHFKKGKCVYVYKDVFEEFAKEQSISLNKKKL